MPWAFWPSWAWRGAAVLLLMGAAIFSATLYAMAVGAPHWLGAITPIGGTLMIAGWSGRHWTTIAPVLFAVEGIPAFARNAP
jgi:uncharacterized membrane protein YgdD (TMEM256/DUF423 family)